MKSFAFIALLLAAFSEAKIRGLTEFREVSNSMVDGSIDYTSVQVSDLRLPSYFRPWISDAVVIASPCLNNGILTNWTPPSVS